MHFTSSIPNQLSLMPHASCIWVLFHRFSFYCLRVDVHFLSWICCLYFFYYYWVLVVWLRSNCSFTLIFPSIWIDVTQGERRTCWFRMFNCFFFIFSVLYVCVCFINFFSPSKSMQLYVHSQSLIKSNLVLELIWIINKWFSFRINKYNVDRSVPMP